MKKRVERQSVKKNRGETDSEKKRGEADSKKIEERQ